uniref:Uncharacterized protein n=1 Tax=Timema cristinae TaxID=61476 RepID=A0A7R9D557_TIMCR|nr:unnamed protein product [Timema cristinae]
MITPFPSSRAFPSSSVLLFLVIAALSVSWSPAPVTTPPASLFHIICTIRTVPGDGYYSLVPGDGYSSIVPGDGYSSIVPGDGYSSIVPGDGYSSIVPGDGYSSIVPGDGPVVSIPDHGTTQSLVLTPEGQDERSLQGNIEICNITNQDEEWLLIVPRNVMGPSWIAVIGRFVFSFLSLQCCSLWLFPELPHYIGLTVLASWLGFFLLPRASKKLQPRRLLPGLDRRAVLISGCDTGFGNLCARRLDAMGVSVYAGCLFPAGPGAQGLKNTCSQNLHLVPLDVTKDEDMHEAVRQVQDTLGHRVLWAVVNNAGIGSYGEVEWSPLDLYLRMFQVNALGTVRMTKTFLPLVRECRGRVVCVASLAGRYVHPNISAYSMSKSAVLAFVDGLRREMDKWSVTVVSIEPALYRTRISDEATMLNDLEKVWASCTRDVQAVYGEQYFQNSKTELQTLLTTARPGLHEVVDDMVDAILGADPKVSTSTSSWAHSSFPLDATCSFCGDKSGEGCKQLLWSCCECIAVCRGY